MWLGYPCNTFLQSYNDHTVRNSQSIVVTGVSIQDSLPELQWSHCEKYPAIFVTVVSMPDLVAQLQSSHVTHKLQADSIWHMIYDINSLTRQSVVQQAVCPHLGNIECCLTYYLGYIHEIIIVDAMVAYLRVSHKLFTILLNSSKYKESESKIEMELFLGCFSLSLSFLTQHLVLLFSEFSLMHRKVLNSLHVNK